MNDFTIKKVRGVTRKNIPEKGETIAEILDISLIRPVILSVKIYLREKNECPFNRGNWIIDIFFINYEMACIKLPIKMEENQVKEYCQPLIDLLENK